MHIVLANQWFPPESGFGGVATYNYHMARAYRELGHRVFVIAKSEPNATTFKNDNGVKVYRVPQIQFSYRFSRIPALGNNLRWLRDILYSHRVKKKLYELHQQYGIDVAEYAEINYEGYWHATDRDRRIPLIVRCHTPYFILQRYFARHVHTMLNNRFILRSERSFIQRADTITTPSHHLAKMLLQELALPTDKAYVIPNAIDVNEFSPDPVKRKKDGGLLILHVGRLEDAKGVCDLARAFVQMVRDGRCEGARLVYVGEDRPTPRSTSQTDELIQFFQENGMLEQVQFTGEVEQQQLVQWYRRADICVVPSKMYESFSYTAMEAMACGKPVIASRIGGIPETVEDGKTGIIISPGNIAQLKSALQILIENPEMRIEMGRAGRQKVERNYSSLAVAKQNLDVYSETIERFKNGKR